MTRPFPGTVSTWWLDSASHRTDPGDETRVRDQGVQRARPTPRETNLIARNSVPASAEPLEDVMEFLVEFDINGPDGTPGTEVADRQTAEASAAAR
jgi:hypothetical protein